MQDYKIFIESLKTNPIQGKSLGGGVYKIRISISSKSKGKSGGARILTYNVKRVNQEKFIVVLSDDPLITPDLIELQLKRGLFLMEDEVNNINSELSPSDEELQNILSSALSTYDTDQSGEF